MLDNNGQVSLEFILFLSFILISLLVFANSILEENELTVAMASARSGVSNGIILNSFSIYNKASFDDYELNKPFLLYPKSINLVKIDYINLGHDDKYNKSKIQFKVYLTCDLNLSKEDKDSIGDRVNYNLRKSIANSFKSENLTNKLYNPVFSDKYIYTTANVQWI